MSANLDQFRSEYDEESLGMLSDILSTLYQNPERSVLREYIANGIDAHRISGYNGPVEVTLPSHDHPKLVIRDHGNGLSREDMQRVYFSYVRSTKRDDDTQIGALGLGAKSAFALTKSWTVTNVHNGVKYIVASVNDDYGAPQQTVLVNGVPTDEGSGITVTIPISERHLSHRWAETAHSLALWLPKGSVSINGSTSLQHWTDAATVYGSTIRSKANTYSSREYNVFQAIMGGIGYVVDDLTKATVRQEATNILTSADFDTAEVHAAMGVYPKAALAKQVEYGMHNVSADAARAGYAHESLRSHLLNTVMDRPLKIDLGDVDFMPSRESVKGTPRTISALAQAVADTVNLLSRDVIAARAKAPEERIIASRQLVRATGVMDREALTAVGIHDSDTDVFTTGVDGARIGAHNIILGNTGRVLVTGVSGTSLYKGKMYAREQRTSVYVTAGDTLRDRNIGDIGRYFRSVDGKSTVMSHNEFKAVVAEKFPANRGGVDTRHSVHVTNGMGGVHQDMVPFSDIEDHLDGITHVFISDDYPHTATLKNASIFGMRAAVVIRGRRKLDTFVKLLGETVVASADGIATAVDTHVVREALRMVSDADADELRALALVQSERAKRVTGELLTLFESAAGELVPADHRARSFVADYTSGAELVATYRGSTLNKAILKVSQMVQDGDDRATPLASRVTADTDPWPLLSGTSKGDSSRAMTHAAMYLAAVG